MPLFKTNKILLNSETVGEVLKKKRLKQKKGLSEIGKNLQINSKYLEALENGQLAKLPAGIYAENYLKTYARFLGLDEIEVVSQYKQENENYMPDEKKVFVQKATKTRYFLSLPKVFKIISIFLVVLACLAYLVFYLNNLLKPPFLEVISPTDDLSTTENTINIEGISEDNANVFINNKEVLLNNDGEFLEPVKLKTGLNKIIISAQKKYSKKIEIIRNILVNP